MNNMRIHFAQTKACPHQGFVYNSHGLAMQFHMETDPDGRGIAHRALRTIPFFWKIYPTKRPIKKEK